MAQPGCRYCRSLILRHFEQFFAGSKGIGYLVGQAGMMFKTDLLFACVVIVATAGIGISAILQRIEGYFQSWRPSSH